MIYDLFHWLLIDSHRGVQMIPGCRCLRKRLEKQIQWVHGWVSNQPSPDLLWWAEVGEVTENVPIQHRREANTTHLRRDWASSSVQSTCYDQSTGRATPRQLWRLDLEASSSPSVWTGCPSSLWEKTSRSHAQQNSTTGSSTECPDAERNRKCDVYSWKDDEGKELTTRLQSIVARLGPYFYSQFTLHTKDAPRREGEVKYAGAEDLVIFSSSSHQEGCTGNIRNW